MLDWLKSRKGKLKGILDGKAQDAGLPPAGGRTGEEGNNPGQLAGRENDR
jgi:hypothetical protein